MAKTNDKPTAAPETIAPETAVADEQVVERIERERRSDPGERMARALEVSALLDLYRAELHLGCGASGIDLS